MAGPSRGRRRALVARSRGVFSLLLAKVQQGPSDRRKLSVADTVLAGSMAPVAALPNCPERIRLYHKETGKRLLLPCRRRVCEYCGPVHWRPRALAIYHSGVDSSDPEQFLAVLLTAPGDVNVRDWNAGASKRWHNFMTILRRTYGDIQFFRVAELQKRGAIHFHVLFRGVKFIPARRLRQIAVSVGFGSWVGIRKCSAYRHGANGGARYFGKYLLKSFPTRLGVSKLLTYSQRWRVTWVSHAREKTGNWLFAGGSRAGWRLVGYDGGSGLTMPLKEAEWMPLWWRHSWQFHRARWAPSRSIWGLDAAEPEPLSSPLRGPAREVWR